MTTKTRSRVPLVALPIVSALAFAGCDADDGAHDDGVTGVDGQDGGEDEPGADAHRVTSVVVGHGGLSYQGLAAGSEQDSRGPAAYLVDDRGFNWIADGPGRQILVVDDAGEIVERYSLEGLVKRVEDIEVTATHLYVLDTGLAQPTVARVGRKDVAATAWESFELPAELGGLSQITGLRQDGDGTVQLELGLGVRVRALFGADGGFLGAGQAEPTSKHRVGDHEVELTGYDIDDPAADRSAGALWIDGVQVREIRTAGMLGGLRFIAAGRDGECWVRVHDVSVLDETIKVRDLAYRFGPAGEVREVVELPMADEVVHVPHRVGFDLDGKLRTLQTALDEVVVVEAAPIDIAVAVQLPPRARAPRGRGEPLQPRSDCVTGAEIMNRAWSYAFYARTYTAANLQNTCANRTPPNSIPVGSLISGVAYRYAGFEEIAAFDSAAAQGKVIGDVSSEKCKSSGCNYGIANCAHGVDCSGFVSKAWGAGHNTTRSIPDISRNIDPSELIPGDALNSYDHHVRLVAEYYGWYGVYVVESTTGDFDRVIGRPLGWDANNGYQAVRWDNHCGYYENPGEPPPPPPPPPTQTPDDPVDPPDMPDDPPPPPDQPPVMTSKDWYFRNSLDSGPGDLSLAYGWDSDRAVVGDWDGDGIDTPAVFRDGTWYLTNGFDSSIGEVEFQYGSPGDIPVAGDWNGDGIDTIGVYRGTTFLLRNSNGGGDPDLAFDYGVAGNVPVIGDWNGDGVDSIGVVSVADGHWYLRNSNSAGWFDADFEYGAGLLPVVGDWDNNGTDTVGVVDPANQTWMLSNVNAAGWFQISFQYGEPGDRPLAGDWNGDGVDTGAITR